MRVFALSSHLSLGCWIAQLGEGVSQWIKGIRGIKGIGCRYLPHIMCLTLARHVKRLTHSGGFATLIG